MSTNGCGFLEISQNYLSNGFKKSLEISYQCYGGFRVVTFMVRSEKKLIRKYTSFCNTDHKGQIPAQAQQLDKENL